MGSARPLECCQLVIETAVRETLKGFSDGQVDDEVVYMTAFEVGFALAQHWVRPEHEAEH